MSSQHIIRLGAAEVPYTLRRSDRTTLAITVEPGGDLVVSAPANIDLSTIEARLRRRGTWVLKTRRDFERLWPRTPGRRFVPGETHRFLGRQYRLVVNPEAPSGVTLTHDNLVVGGLEAKDPARIRVRLELWYQREARKVFSARLDANVRAAAIANRRPRLVIQPLEKRWGSLSGTGRTLLLNRRLVEADLDCIDFVIVHELCHLDHRNHGGEFQALLASRLPDWRARKARLERWML